MWRYVPGYVADQIADIFFRVEFVVEVDIEPALKALEENGCHGPASVAAVRRRGDMALPPFFKTLWLTQELTSVDDPARIELLSRPYAPDTQNTPLQDFNLNARRWQSIGRLNIPELDYWPEFCGKARVQAEETLRVEADLAEKLMQADRRAASVDHGRLGQLRARANSGSATNAGEEQELLFEERLSAALRNGIRLPHIRIDAIGAIFLSGDREAVQTLGGDA
jgi:ATP-dependent helicase HepA